MERKLDLREKVQHGSAIFPLAIYDNIFAYEDKIILPHWHDEFEIIYIEKGCANIRVDNIIYNVSGSNILFINCGSFHTGKAISHEIKAYAIVFKLDFLYANEADICKNRFFLPLQNHKINIQTVITDSDINKLIWEIIETYYNKEQCYELLLKSLLYKIFYIIFKQNYIIHQITCDESFNIKFERIKVVLDYINYNYSKPLKIEDLCKVINVSKYYFYHLFKEIMHITPLEYINRYRIKKAVELIKNTDVCISEIAFEVGFNNVSYFIRIFKEYIGMSPLKYKKWLTED